MDRNPYASPAIAAGPGVLRRVPIEAVPQEPELGLATVLEQAASPPRAWRIAFARQQAWLFVPDEQSAFVFTHAELAENATILLWGGFVAVTLTGLLSDGRAIAFKLEGDAKELLRRWIHEAHALHVASALRRRLRAALPIGIFATAVALPILGDKLDPFQAAFGIGLVALSILGPRHPRPIMLALDGIVWWLLAASHVVAAVNGSKLSIALALLTIFFGRQSLRAYAFYR